MKEKERIIEFDIDKRIQVKSAILEKHIIDMITDNIKLKQQLAQVKEENAILQKALEIAKEWICQNCTLKSIYKSFCECECNARNIEYFLHQAQIELKGGARDTHIQCTQLYMYLR